MPHPFLTPNHFTYQPMTNREAEKVENQTPNMLLLCLEEDEDDQCLVAIIPVSAAILFIASPLTLSLRSKASRSIVTILWLLRLLSITILRWIALLSSRVKHAVLSWWWRR